MQLCRKMLALAALCGLAFVATGQGQTGLTTIQDTLFKADGTRFNGTLTIQWSTFDAVDIGTIVQQSKSVQVVNGTCTCNWSLTQEYRRPRTFIPCTTRATEASSSPSCGRFRQARRRLR
jgi:hypothetical protein